MEYLDGPAVEYDDGDDSWFKHGDLHRIDGPAIDWVDEKQWWIDGKRIHCKDNEEFLRIVKMKVLL
jgi:hypothetical protein